MTSRKESHAALRELIVLTMLGTLMFLSKLLMEALPNVHLMSMLTIVYTVVYRTKALIPIYIAMFLIGFVNGFGLWWVPYLYLWAVLWAVTMLLPKRMPAIVAAPVYSFVCALHGLAFGTLYAPFWAIAAKLSFKSTLAWIAAGLPWDVTHAIGNLVASVLILPLVGVLTKLEKRFGRN